MGKKLLSFTTILMSLILLLIGCTKPNDKVSDGFTLDENKVVEGAIHIFNKAETNDYILLNNQTEYKIVVPTTPSVREITASLELKNLFMEATGVTLEIITDTGITLNSQSKYLSIGATTLRTAANIDVNYELLGQSGVRVITKDKTVFMSGAEDFGTLYSVYEFLKQTVSFEYYYTDTYSLDKNVKDIKLMNYDIIDVPDIQNRVAGYGYISGSQNNINRMRMRPYADFFAGSAFHNSFGLLPPSIYKESHPKWYSTDGTQLSYTAQGDEEELKLMKEKITEKLMQILMNEPNKHMISITMQDTQTWDSSEATMAMYEIYGSHSAAIIMFCNDVNKKIRNWFTSEEGRDYERELEILFFAYHRTNGAPVTYDEETKTYKPINGLVCDQGVTVLFAETDGDYTHSMNEIENDRIYKNLQGWQVVSPKFSFWFYGTNYANYLIPYNSFNSLNDNYRIAVESDAIWVFEQGQIDQASAATGWSILKGYLASKLAWNVNYNMQELIEDFFKNYFGQASDIMLKLFNEYRVHAAYIEENKGYGGSRSIFFNAMSDELWPKALLDRFNCYLDEAISKIEYLKQDDIEKYYQYYNHITCERLSVIYLLVELYEPNIESTNLLTLKQTFKEDATRIGLSHLKENGSISDLYRSWGV